jgi:hypothetical protein
VREERREVLILFRRKEYCTREYAYFVCAVRSLFPWFCNSNGPRKRVLWGNPAPVAVANLITGHWARDVYALKSPGGAQRVIRPAIASGHYFTTRFAPVGRREVWWPERLLAHANHWRIRTRGAKGGLFFVDRRQLRGEQIAILERLGRRDEPIAAL